MVQFDLFKILGINVKIDQHMFPRTSKSTGKWREEITKDRGGGGNNQCVIALIVTIVFYLVRTYV